MVKRYEFDMVAVHDMGARSAEDWEQASGPVEGHRGWACLMRREVVPGRVVQVEPREEVQGFQSRPPLCGRTWGADCMGAIDVPHMCHDVPGHEGPCRLCGTCGARELLSRPYVDDHPPAADGVSRLTTASMAALAESVRDPLRNCWTCVHSNPAATSCDAPGSAAVGRWIHGSHTRAGAVLRCPPTADGCPGWAPKATP